MAKIDEIKVLIGDFPQTSGVYLMKNKVDRIIYVGKAKNLRSRVRSYFTQAKDLSGKTKLLVTHIEKVEFILTPSEVEAFLLEASLIKKHKPHYNIRLKDDKSYPYIKFSMTDDFPRIYLSRKVKRDGSAYFGPFTQSRSVWQTIKFLNGAFQIRDCSDHFFKKRARPCLTHEIGRCTAPCVGLISDVDYREYVKNAILFLKGKNKKVLKNLKDEMKTAAENERFEQAAKIRDAIVSIDAILEKQTVINDKVDTDQDVVQFHGDERGLTVEILSVRAGRVLGSRPFFITKINPMDPQEDAREWLISFLNQYYLDNYIPDQVFVPHEITADVSVLFSKVLKSRGEKEVDVRNPQDSNQTKLSDMALANAKNHFKQQVSGQETKAQALEEIKNKLHLPELPKRIECYDISHFQGGDTVASQVVFEDGEKNTDQYRRYKLKTITGVNDYESMKEVLTRRLAHTEYDDPQLILIDGGKGQLNVVVEVLKDLNRMDLPVASLAKARTESGFEEAEIKTSRERFFLPGRSNPVLFRENSEAYKILINLRDEAHRFAITYHRKLRDETSLKSILDDISGIGEKRKKTLLLTFMSLDAICEAKVEDIAKLSGFNEELAKKVLLNLNEKIHSASDIESDESAN